MKIIFISGCTLKEIYTEKQISGFKGDYSGECSRNERSGLTSWRKGLWNEEWPRHKLQNGSVLCVSKGGGGLLSISIVMSLGRGEWRGEFMQ